MGNSALDFLDSPVDIQELWGEIRARVTPGGSVTDTQTHRKQASQNHEFCIQNEEFCIKNGEFCIKNEEVLNKMMNFEGVAQFAEDTTIGAVSFEESSFRIEKC